MILIEEDEDRQEYIALAVESTQDSLYVHTEIRGPVDDVLVKVAELMLAPGAIVQRRMCNGEYAIVIIRQRRLAS